MARTAVRSGIIGAAAMLSVLAAACDPSPPSSTTTTSAGPSAVTVCRTERAEIRTAYAASAASHEAGGTDTALSYLVDPGGIVYFTLESGPTTGPVARTAATLGAVPESDCASIPTSEIPLGSS